MKEYAIFLPIYVNSEQINQDYTFFSIKTDGNSIIPVEYLEKVHQIEFSLTFFLFPILLFLYKV